MNQILSGKKIKTFTPVIHGKNDIKVMESDAASARGTISSQAFSAPHLSQLRDDCVKREPCRRVHLNDWVCANGTIPGSACKIPECDASGYFTRGAALNHACMRHLWNQKRILPHRRTVYVNNLELKLGSPNFAILLCIDFIVAVETPILKNKNKKSSFVAHFIKEITPEQYYTVQHRPLEEIGFTIHFAMNPRRVFRSNHRNGRAGCALNSDVVGSEGLDLSRKAGRGLGELWSIMAGAWGRPWPASLEEGIGAPHRPRLPVVLACRRAHAQKERERESDMLGTARQSPPHELSHWFKAQKLGSNMGNSLRRCEWEESVILCLTGGRAASLRGTDDSLTLSWRGQAWGIAYCLPERTIPRVKRARTRAARVWYYAECFRNKRNTYGKHAIERGCYHSQPPTERDWRKTGPVLWILHTTQKNCKCSMTVLSKNPDLLSVPRSVGRRFLRPRPDVKLYVSTTYRAGRRLAGHSLSDITRAGERHSACAAQAKVSVPGNTTSAPHFNAHYLLHTPRPGNSDKREEHGHKTRKRILLLDSTHELSVVHISDIDGTTSTISRNNISACLVKGITFNEVVADSTGSRLRLKICQHYYYRNLYPPFHMYHPCVVMREHIGAGINYTRLLQNNC
ncbi:hypothetical protein PR048_018654 [Dryococelus australis]|uniref:Uncharacterized protein n=1 Tax=Dryococelus australis TaxID=614101 RepID=A0ABQ9HCW5_9NEOP|nr:hypothetical protein PR048_018654 [Dryococelus australis]